jgi:hypothetical protein
MHDDIRSTGVDRRRFLQLGGLGAVSAAVLAACGGRENGGLARVGNAPVVTPLPDPVVNDGVLLRTAASIERSAVSFYDTIIADPELLDPSNRTWANVFRDNHEAHASTFDGLVGDVGAEVWECSNPRIDEFVIDRVMELIQGAPKTEDTPEVPPTDDPKRDVLNFLHAFESMMGAWGQALVPLLSQGTLRQQAVMIGAREARQAALIALTVTGRPDGYVAPADAPANPPEFPVEYAIPAPYGQLSGQQFVLGAPNESGVRTTITLETPSLNTYVYDYLTPSC